MRYEKRCEWCDCDYVSTRKHSRTCSDGCRYKLWKGGFSNKKVMDLVVMLPTVYEANQWLKNVSKPGAIYNYCTEESGHCYIYKYTDEYLKENRDRLTSCRRLITKNSTIEMCDSQDL